MISRVEKYEEHDAITVDGLATPTTTGESASEGYKSYVATPSIRKAKKKKKPHEGSDSSPTTLLQQFVASDASTREVVKEDCKKIAVYFAKITRMMTIDKLKRFCQVDQMKQLIREQRVELYNTLKSWTTGEPRDAIRALRAENIENARDRIKALYAKSSYSDQQELLNRLKNGQAFVVVGRGGAETPRAMRKRIQRLNTT